jgi:hypothetical protein
VAVPRASSAPLWLALLLGSSATGCFVEVPLNDKQCDGDHSCIDGYWCDDGTCREGGGPGTGEERGPCFEDGSCDPGLSCVSDLCVRLGDDDAGPPLDGGPDLDSGPLDAGPPDAGPLEDPLAGIFGDDVLGYWSFNEGIADGVADYSKNELTGAAFGADDAGVADAGAVGLPTEIIGTFFKGVRFDGENDYIEIEDSPVFDFGTGNFAVEAWVRTSSTCDTEHAIVSRWTPGMLWFLSCWDNPDDAVAGGTAGFILRDSENFADRVRGATIINDGEWHHLLAVREPGRLMLYVDGAPDGAQDVAFFGNFSGTAPLQLGRYNAGDGFYFPGDVDEVRLWGRALAGSDVARVYATFGVGLRGHWAFERSLRNLGGALFPATVVGGASFVPALRGVGMELDGVNDSVAIVDYPQGAYTTDWSISLWFKAAVSPDAGVQLLNNEITSRAPVNVWLEPDGLHAIIRDSASATLETSVAGVFDDGEWHHVVATRQGSDEGAVTLTLWGDGTMSTPASGDIALTETALELRVGARAIEDPRHFAGDVDELQMYNRALDDAQVQLLYDTNR